MINVTSGDEKNELSTTIQAAMKDMAVKQAERNLNLGELQERVLGSLDLDRVKSEKKYPEILTAIEDPRATHMLIHHSIPIDLGAKYEKPAHNHGLVVTYVSDPAYKGPTGLVVAADDAVD